MSDGGSEQQKLDETAKEARDRTVQERVQKLYDSNKLSEVAVGFWLKLCVEITIIAVPLFFLVAVPLLGLAHFDFGPVTYTQALTVWIVFTSLLIESTWCFTDNALQEGEED